MLKKKNEQKELVTDEYIHSIPHIHFKSRLSEHPFFSHIYGKTSKRKHKIQNSDLTQRGKGKKVSKILAMFLS